ncbi:hypothetical protein [Sulfidibacter corallicola]|uniref:EF-hand domain-containing protein n=1 Tax=Sulfidibacter corallicola TaxID=2818388 RepID=A0A8A4TFI1_SULCO|nr:hypothetical protein [Sulfidibacter corallicola]QTD48393.1 hypothetical protein J3U87_22665 [Sulfidibacter corallicola]
MLAPVPSWGPNTTQSLTFNIHMVDNSFMCPDLGPANLPADCLTFEVGFTHAANPNLVFASDSSNQLRFSNPPADGIRVVDVISDTNPAPRTEGGGCSLYNSSSWTVPIRDQGLNRSQVDNTSYRLFLGIDWNLNVNNVPSGENLEWWNGLASFQYPLGNSYYDLWVALVREEIAMIDPSTQIFDASNRLFPQRELGGHGLFNQIDCDSETWNFFDITEQEVNGQTVREVLTSPVSIPVRFQQRNTRVNFRSAALYVMNVNGCTQASAFGDIANLNAFQFTQFAMDEDGNAEAAVSVPAAWRSGNQLTGSYTIEWYYRQTDSFARATRIGGGTTDPRALSTDLSLPSGEPGEYQIEARIKHSSGAVISVVSPAHGLTYQSLVEPLFLDAEDPIADTYLDLGEILEQPFSFRNDTGANATVRITLGSVSPADAQIAFGTDSQGLVHGACADSRQVISVGVNNGSTLNLGLWYRLLQLSRECESLRFSIDVAYTQGSFTSSYKQTFSVLGNCQDEAAKWFESDFEKAGATVPDNPFNVDLDGLLAFWGFCPNTPLAFPVLGQGNYRMRWFDGAESLCSDAPEAGVNGAVWADPDLTETGDIFVEIRDLDNDVTRVYPFRIVVVDVLPAREDLLPRWRESTNDDVDMNGDGFVDLLDMLIFYSAGGCGR